MTCSCENIEWDKRVNMTNYEHSKKARRVASLVYLIIMSFIFIGTYLSNEEKAAAKKMPDPKEVVTFSQKAE